MSTVLKYSDYADRPAASRRSHDILRDSVQVRSGDWRLAGVALDGLAYPEGEWPGTPVGGGRAARPEIGIATHAEPVEIGAGRLAGRFLVRDDAAGTEVAEDEIQRFAEGLQFEAVVTR